MMTLDATTPTRTCPHCGDRDCDVHCPEAPDGRHLIDGQSARLGAQHDLGNGARSIGISVTCRRCEQSGDFRFAVSQEQVAWDGP